MNKIQRIFILTLFCILCITSCVSKPKFSGTGDLCGIVIDENNKPVKDFVVYCKPSVTNIKTTTINIKPVMTNESGLFVFYELPSGAYNISGEKENYLRISETSYHFSDRGKIICFQIKSFAGAIKAVDELLNLDQKKDAMEILNDINTNKSSAERYFVKAYQFFAVENEKDKKSIIRELRAAIKRNLIPYPENIFFKNFLEKLEEVRDE